jgi:hypothetical protein
MISKNTVIGFLIFSAVFLVCVLVLQNTMEPQSAYGKAVGMQGSGCVATIAQVESGSDAIWMLKTDAHLLMAYQTDSKGRIVLLGAVDLEQIFSRARQGQINETPAEEGGSAPVPRRRR